MISGQGGQGQLRGVRQIQALRQDLLRGVQQIQAETCSRLRMPPAKSTDPAGRAKALEEVRAQHQAEKRKAEQQAARFAKRQAAMLEYESCLANSPYRTARSAGEASRGGSGDTSASSRPPQQFREGMNCPECLTGVLSAKTSQRGRRYMGCSSFRPGVAAADQSCSFFRPL